MKMDHLSFANPSSVVISVFGLRKVFRSALKSTSPVKRLIKNGSISRELFCPELKKEDANW